jgi:WD40 repeat protein
VRLWDAATGEELVRLPGHSDYVFALAFSPDGKTLVSSSGDTTLRLWDTEPRAASPRTG